MLSDLTELGIQFLKRDLLLVDDRKEILQRLFCDTQLFGNGAMFLEVNILNIVDDDGAFVGLGDGGTRGEDSIVLMSRPAHSTRWGSAADTGSTHCQDEAHEARRFASV